jgi:hypothetical protein
MKKVRASLPSLKHVVITIAACLVLAVLTGRFESMILPWSLVCFGYLALVVLRNYDPVAWEAHYSPRVHVMRRDRDEVVAQLASLIAACEGGDREAIAREVKEANELLSYFTTTAR